MSHDPAPPISLLSPAAMSTTTCQPVTTRRPLTPGLRPTRVPKLGIWAWCFVGFVVAAVIVVHRARRGERDRAADDVRRRAGHRSSNRWSGSSSATG